jgi:type IV secretion system protein VirB10
MRLNTRLKPRQDSAEQRDPREEGGAQIIDLATRNVLPTVSQRKRGDGLGMIAGIALVALLGGVTLWSMDAARNGPAPQGEPAATAPAPAPQAIGVPAPVAPAPLPAPAPQPVLAAPPQTGIAAAPSANPHSSPTVVFDASGAAAPLAVPAGPAATGGAGNSNDDFAARLGGTGGGKAVADASFDPRTTVTQGTLIPAVLETAIDTDVPGFVRAVVSSDVRSFDGSQVLIPRSSRLVGQYKSGLSAGQKRAYVIWTRLIRPDGVSVNIASPAVGFGGETGLKGKVDSHFFERFGSSMLLSVIGGIPALIGNSASVIVGGGGQSAAAAAIGQSGQISPTVRVRQGQPIRVFTSKDLDFSKVM